MEEKSNISQLLTFYLPLYYLSFYLCRYGVLPVGPILVEKNSISMLDYGFSLSALYTGYFLMLIPAGVIVRKISVKKTIYTGVLGTISANIIILLANSSTILFVALFLNGISQGLIWPSLMQIVALNSTKKDAEWTVGLMMTSAILGPSIVFIIGSILISLNLWWAIFILGPSLLAVLTLKIIKTRINVRTQDIYKTTFLTKKSLILGGLNKEIIILSITYFCFYSILRGIVGWLPYFLIHEFNLKESLASLGSGIFPILETVGAFIGGYLSNRTKNFRKIFNYAFFLSFLLLSLYSFFNFPALTLGLAFILISLPEWLFFSKLSYLVEKEHVGFASGFIDMMGYIGSSTSNIIIGYIISTTKDYRNIILILTLYSLLGFIFSLLIKSHKLSST